MVDRLRQPKGHGLEEAMPREDIVLANAFKTRIIAEAQIKTDKVAARILADLLRAAIGTLAVTLTALEHIKVCFGEDYHPFWHLASLHNGDLVHDLRSCEPMRIKSF